MATRNPFDLPPGRILALDNGERRVGMAVSDSGRRVASSAGIAARQPWGELRAAVLKWKEQGVAAAVVGLPLSMDGSEGPECVRARSLADLIEKECGLPVLLWDERLTSAQAEAAYFEQRSGRQTRASKKDSSGKVDGAAAAVLLGAVLERLKA